MATAGASNGAIVYDPLGRIFQYAGAAGGTTLTFLYDGDALVAEYDGAGTRLYIFDSKGEIVDRYLHSFWGY